MGTAGDNASSRTLAGHAALVVVQLCFGLFPVFGLLAMDPAHGFEALGVASWRILGGTLALGLLGAWRHGRDYLPPRAEWGKLLLLALFGIVLNQGLFLIGLSRSTATNAGLIICLVPVFTFTVAALARQEVFQWTRALGVAFALAGTAPLIFSGGAEFLGDYAFGNLLMVANALCYSIYLVLSKPLTARYPALLVIAWVYLFSVPFVPLFLARGSMAPAPGATAAVWGSLAYVLVFATVLGYLLNVFALARVRASTTAVYVYVQPLITGVASYYLLEERLSPGMLRAAVLLFIGIALVSRRPRAGRELRTPAAASPEG